MSAEEVIELVEEFRPNSVQNVEVDHETKDFIFLNFSIQSYSGDWHKARSVFIRKAELKTIK